MTTSVVDSSAGLRAVTRAYRPAGQRGSCFQGAHPHQVVGRRGEEELPVHQASAAVAELAQAANRLHPAEHFFDASLASCPLAFLNNRLSGSVVDWCV